MWKQPVPADRIHIPLTTNERREAAYLAEAMNARVRRTLRKAHRSAVPWLILGTSLTVLALLLWFQQSNAVQSSNGFLHSAMAKVKSSVGHLDQRVVNWDAQQLQGKLGQAEGTLSEHAKTVRAKAQSAWLGLQAKFGQDSTDQRLRQLESQRNADDHRVAALEGDLARVKGQVGAQDGQIAALRTQNSTTLASATGLTPDLANFSRVDFEVNRDQAREVYQGITVKLDQLDPVNRTFSGTVNMLPEKQSIELKQQSTFQAITIPSVGLNPGGQLVFTQVTQDAAVGYFIPAANR